MKISNLILFYLMIITFCNCKRELASTQNADKKSSIVYERLRVLTNVDSLETFLELFNENEFDPNHVENEVTLLFNAASKGNVEICKVLIEKGGDVNFISKYGTVMHWALEKRNIEVGHLLLNNGYNPEVEKKLSNNSEPLSVICAHLVRRHGDKGIELFKKLLDNGLDPDMKDMDGASAIHLAIYFESLELVRLLHQSGADMNLKILESENKSFPSSEIFVTNNYTPLMLAAHLDKKTMLEELLSYKKVKTNLMDKEGKTALDIAIEKKNGAIIEILSNASIN